MSKLDSKIPHGPLAEKWTNHKNHMNLVAPNNRDKIDIIVLSFYTDFTLIAFYGIAYGLYKSSSLSFSFICSRGLLGIDHHDGFITYSVRCRTD